ncbi:MAG: hypothetical protein OXG53_19640 [Chloroflexi bacterium]|nr:hypothetical protein [Chloroflexota bacterium]
MSFRDFITALPKVELNLQLTGALRMESLLLIANQNGIPAQMDDFSQWVEHLTNPDPKRIDEIARVAGSWALYPEDIALVVYDIGVALAKQNVRYAEVAVAPSDFIGSAKMNFDTFIDALNDGRDRSRRAWNVDMSWIFSIPRDNPRAGDDVARWASGSAGRLGNVVAIALVGPEDAQPLGQFHRAFATAHKKELPAAASAGDSAGASEIREIIDELQPGRLVNAWRLAEDASLLNHVVETGIPLVNSMTRALKTGQMEKAQDIPAARLQEANAQLVLSCDNPSLYHSSLLDEYVMAREDCGLSSESLVQMARRAIELSFLDGERKANMLRDFDFLANSPQARFLDQE